MALPSSANGSYSGNGTSQDVNLGFKPSKVEIYNETDQDSKAEHSQGQPADSAWVTGTAPSFAFQAANAVTLKADGFSVGSDASVNESAKTFRWVAFR